MVDTIDTSNILCITSSADGPSYLQTFFIVNLLTCGHSKFGILILLALIPTDILFKLNVIGFSHTVLLLSNKSKKNIH